MFKRSLFAMAARPNPKRPIKKRASLDERIGSAGRKPIIGGSSPSAICFSPEDSPRLSGRPSAARSSLGVQVDKLGEAQAVAAAVADYSRAIHRSPGTWRALSRMCARFPPTRSSSARIGSRPMIS